MRRRMSFWTRVHFRRRVVKVIKNVILLYILGAGLWSLCYVSGWVLERLGVG